MEGKTYPSHNEAKTAVVGTILTYTTTVCSTNTIIHMKYITMVAVNVENEVKKSSREHRKKEKSLTSI